VEWNLWEAIIRVVISLPIICLAAYLFIKFGLAKKYPHNRGSLRVMEQINLTPRASITIIKVGGEFLLVSATDSEVKVIKPMENYHPEESREIQLQLSENWKRLMAGRGSKHA
jgi:flagellar biosynthetic protein FliO